MLSLSVSQVLAYLSCPEQYKYRYVERARAPASLAAARGRAVHRAVEANYRHKLRAGQDLPPEEVEREAAAAFDAEAARAVRAEGEDPAVFREQAVALAALYRREVAPGVVPALVEARVEVPLEGAECTLVGFVDLVDAGGVIRDTKTASRAPAPGEASRSLQLTAYALAYRKLAGRREAGLRLDHLVLAPSGPEHVALEAPARPAGRSTCSSAPWREWPVPCGLVFSTRTRRGACARRDTARTGGSAGVSSDAPGVVGQGRAGAAGVCTGTTSTRT